MANVEVGIEQIGCITEFPEDPAKFAFQAQARDLYRRFADGSVISDVVSVQAEPTESEHGLDWGYTVTVTEPVTHGRVERTLETGSNTYPKFTSVHYCDDPEICGDEPLPPAKAIHFISIVECVDMFFTNLETYLDQQG